MKRKWPSFYLIQAMVFEVSHTCSQTHILFNAQFLLDLIHLSVLSPSPISYFLLKWEYNIWTCSSISHTYKTALGSTSLSLPRIPRPFLQNLTKLPKSVISIVSTSPHPPLLTTNPNLLESLSPTESTLCKDADDSQWAISVFSFLLDFSIALDRTETLPSF